MEEMRGEGIKLRQRRGVNGEEGVAVAPKSRQDGGSQDKGEAVSVSALSPGPSSILRCWGDRVRRWCRCR